MSLRSIRLYPDPVLRVDCIPVEAFDDALRELVTDMAETMYAAPGIGLAAPQVGVELQVAVVDVSGSQETKELHVLVNPEVVREAGEWVEVEGCLSIPEISEKVVRPMEIVVRYQDLDGRTQELEAEEWLARAVCHEIDHLHGILFPDRLRGLRRQRVQRQLRRVLRDKENAGWQEGFSR